MPVLVRSYGERCFAQCYLLTLGEVWGKRSLRRECSGARSTMVMNAQALAQTSHGTALDMIIHIPRLRFHRPRRKVAKNGTTDMYRSGCE